MSILNRLIAAVKLPEEENAREDARGMALALTDPGDWLTQVIEHHRGIERAFGLVRAAGDNTSRTASFRRLGILLTGHAIAEEGVIYPALAHRRGKAHSDVAYDEQAAVKVQMAMLEKLNPMSDLFVSRLCFMQGAVEHHMYCEESKWFFDLKREASATDQAGMTERYAEEYHRYVGDDRG